jgi:hypothetical protein
MKHPTTNNIFYKHVVVDIPHVYMKPVVGKKGAHLKNYCKEYKVNNIWFNMNRNLIEIWGPNESLGKVASVIQDKITKAKKKIPKPELTEFQSKFHVSQDVFTSGSLDDTISKENVKHLIGKNGINFKKITRLSNVSYIWYNDSKHTVDIWGPQENLQNAIGMLFSLITTVNSSLIHGNRAEENILTVSEQQQDVDMCLD